MWSASFTPLWTDVQMVSLCGCEQNRRRRAVRFLLALGIASTVVGFVLVSSLTEWSAHRPGGSMVFRHVKGGARLVPRAPTVPQAGGGGSSSSSSSSTTTTTRVLQTAGASTTLFGQGPDNLHGSSSVSVPEASSTSTWSSLSSSSSSSSSSDVDAAAVVASSEEARLWSAAKGNTSVPVAGIQRAEDVQKTCQELHMPDQSTDDESHEDLKRAMLRRFIVDGPHNLLYCPIEKVGSSFWKRVFQILKQIRDRKQGVTLKNISVFDLSGIRVHRLGDMRKDNEALLDSDFLHTARKFMFVRDPYERLFSGFIDKILALTFETHNIVRVVLASHSYDPGEKPEKGAKRSRSRLERNQYPRDDKEKRRSRNDIEEHSSPNDKEKRRSRNDTEKRHSRNDVKSGRRLLSEELSPPRRECTLHATFEDFVRYLLRGVHVNPHFHPMSSICPPCSLPYDFIGKMDTFRQDARSLLTWADVNPQSVLSSDVTFDRDSDLSIMRDVTDRTFKIVGKYQGCMTRREMLLRTWVTFQVRGFLSINQTFPFTEQESQNVDRDLFIRVINTAYAHSGPREVRMRQRKLAMMEAFSGLPRTLLRRLKTYVDTDCRLFGYECSVEKRFPPGDLPEPVFHFDRLMRGNSL
ncbi:uncharacterized protein LOC143287156 [Babylonia areolata]|uniref:uncharacterized protein LOC143287156 n=1 Tax=Babylonia areolata TaxID=304850 RepID=UPI003FCF2CD6